MNATGTILAVDDTPESLAWLVTVLTTAGYQVRPADSGELALAAVAANPPDLILLDVRMKGLDGLEVCRRLKAREETCQIPIILIRAFSDETDWVAGLRLGAADYVTKPFRTEELLSRVMTHLSLGQARRSLGQQATELRRANDQLHAELVERQRVEDAMRDSLERSDRSRLAMLSILEDQKQAERAHRLQSAALNAAADAMIITDRHGTIEWTNAAFSRLTGYTATETMGKNPRDLVKSGVHDQAFYRELWTTILAGNVWHGETTNRRKDGSLYPEEQTITSVKNDRGELTHFISIKRDLTKQHQLEAELRQSQKMETLGRLAGGVAHDFNNMLTVINGTAELAVATMDAGNPLRAELQDIRGAGLRAAALTRQLLAFSRKQVMKFEVVNLSALVADAQGMLQRLLGEDLALVVKSAKDAGSVMADPVQIQQVLMNLAVNARDAMPDGGTLTIETRDVALGEADAATDPSVRPGPYVMLAVGDTGIGMDEATSARVFEPFFTTKALGAGTGLGLSMVYGIVKQSDGSIRLHSELGTGTTFEIFLPQVKAVVRPSPLAPIITSVRGTETVLVVEDEDVVRHLAVRILQLAGYTVLTAHNGVEALALLETHKGPVHLMLTDMVMPGLSGLALAVQVKDLHPRTKILFTSGYTDDAALSRGAPVDDTHFIGKPYSIASLTHKVREVLVS